MTLEQRVRKLERANHILVVCLLTAFIGLGAFAATRSGTITVDRIITGPKGLWFESPNGCKLAWIVAGGVEGRAGTMFKVCGPEEGVGSVLIRGGGQEPYLAGGAVSIMGEMAGGARSAAASLSCDKNGGYLRLLTLGSQQRATLEVVPEGGARLCSRNGAQVMDEWP